ncbi:related to Zn-finger protein [Rhynchosporium agropyri]|uniref:Related to Zn-finger protein n=1 Tax=Rhynchosporium agropyri TaxID=914238 RepID=A0A1E1KRM5_9HELO|nr:related to Zn-finger protein [Rhynchosporium agropyri]
MSSLVSDFLINPVLRQARRFSRSNPPNSQVVPVTNQHTTLENTHEIAVDDIAERLDGLGELRNEENAGSQGITGAVLTSSPIEEDAGLDAELRDLEDMRPPSAPPILNGTRPHRVSSLLSDHGHPDEETSNNPSFGIPNRFRASSAASTTISNRNSVVARMSPAEASSRRSTQERGGQVGSNNRPRNSSLPEDDGMGTLRQEIIRIQAMDIPGDEKARLMHRLLTQQYSEAQEIFHAKQPPVAPSPASMISQERPTTPGSLSSFIWQMNGAPEPANADQQHTFHLSPADLKRTYALPDTETDEDGNVTMKDEVDMLGCKHYKRNVKLQCSACDKWYTCRLCHDEVEDHVLNRKATKNMLCMLCSCAQRAGEFCVNCGDRAAWYYCDICKLWDNDADKSIYHCDDCGICRKGRGLGKDVFHCKTCGTCMSMASEKSHKCIERNSDCDCPICGEYMFTSPSPVVFMLCGHGIHRACYDKHMKSSYKCPICSKSTVNMETQFRNLDRAIDLQPMPPQFRDTKAMVSCNDCYAKSAVTYHWLGLKCAICDSYNTAQLSILSDPAVEVPQLESREVEHVVIPDQPDMGASFLQSPPPGPVRQRRHSAHIHMPSLLAGGSYRFEPYARRARSGRSVSPIRGPGFFHEPAPAQAVEREELVGEDDMDFWGRNEPPHSSASVENVDHEMEDEEDEEEESDDDSLTEDDEDVDEEDEFELLGHR